MGTWLIQPHLKKGTKLTFEDFLGKPIKSVEQMESDYKRIKEKNEKELGKPMTNNEIIAKLSKLRKKAL